MEKQRKMSDMMQHYVEMKEKYKDCILFYRLGDFYEMFFDDAIKVSSLLDLTLTGKDCGMEERAPMCGIPYHAADTYIAKLVSMGEKVAVCEQLSDPKEAGRGLVERDVVRIVSAGTLAEDSLLDETKNNYLACLSKTQEGIAAAWADITTGEFYVTEFKGEAHGVLTDVVALLLRYGVAEVICNDDMALLSKEVKEIKRGALPPFSCYVPWAFNVKHAEKNLLEQFHAASLAAYGIAGKENCIAAAGALVEYLRETQKRSLENISFVTLIDRSEYVELDAAAVKNLELLKNNAEGKKYGSLLWVLDKTKTPMGARLMRQWVVSPLKSVEKINERLSGVEELYTASVLRVGLQETLGGIKDIGRLAGKISYGNVTPRDLEALKKSLELLPSLKFRLSGFSAPALKKLLNDLPAVEDITELLGQTIAENAPVSTKDGGYIREGYNAELDELRGVREHAAGLIKEMEAREREKTDIRTLKIGFNRVFGYYIEVSNSFKDKVPPEYIRKQTLTTGERYITEELKTLEERILTGQESALKLEEKIFSYVLSALQNRLSDLLKAAETVAQIDCLTSLAAVSKERRYARPKITEEGGALTITEGRHPVVEAISKERFVPNDALMDGEENRSLIITGPNMAGKSTYMRQVALITVMAHIGCFVPAKSAQIPLIDRVFTRVGASDNLVYDQSTFMVEMTEVATILLHATKNSLLVLDEVGRGTSTYDGLSIAWAVIEYLTEKVRAKTLFSTHYHELTELESTVSGVKNYKVTVRELGGGIVFLRKIQRGGANRSFGIEVASLAGVPREVTDRARGILKLLEKSDVAKQRALALSELSATQAGEEINGENAEETARSYQKENSAQNERLLEVKEILAETNVDTLSPLQALMLLNDLKQKFTEE
ncbi:MAG: DNA mismatch repair protein MutS [Candidatus Borkfalkiaceae bacterium]|nr:DNA mismatch repair protein MutS [Clostridia bacterium]MDY6222617.1 DNA mismatch repair protein MutS [Christensenellaceae bacterium]